jgi:hypothetical protein
MGSISLAAAGANVLPTEQIGMVVLTNTFPMGVPEAICRTYLDLVLTGKVERDWLALFGGVFAKAMAPEYGASVGCSKLPNPSSRCLCWRLSQRSVRRNSDR